MDATATKILGLLESADVELRKAAVRVVAEMGLSSPPVVLAVGRCLREPNEDVQLAALRALAKLGAGDVSHLVIPLILSSGVVRDHAMIVISALGDAAVKPLVKLYSGADHAGKRAIITALSAIGGKPAIEFLLKQLPNEPFELQQHIATQVCEALQSMDAREQAKIFGAIQRLLRGTPDPRSPQVPITALILLGYVKGTALLGKAKRILTGFADPKHLPEIRRFALLALNRLQPQDRRKTAPPDVLRFALKMMCDDDWENVAQHALTGFRQIELPPKSLPTLVQLLEKSPHFAVHIHVFERLRTHDKPEVARAILPFLADPRFRVREAAEAALRQMPSGIEALFELLTESEDLDVTQRVNAVLREFTPEIRRKFLDRAVERLLLLFERKDARHLSFLEFVRAVDADPLRAKIYQLAKKLKAGNSRNKWEEICSYIQLLWEHHLITAEGRFLFGIALLAQSSRRLDPASRRADLSLRVLRALVIDSHEDLLRKLRLDRDLGVEEYFYLGFHFSESQDIAGKFGRDLLEYVIRKYPRHKLAAQAQNKVELQTRLAAEAARPGRRKKAATPAPTEKPPLFMPDSILPSRKPARAKAPLAADVPQKAPISLGAASPTSAARTARSASRRKPAGAAKPATSTKPGTAKKTATSKKSAPAKAGTSRKTGAVKKTAPAKTGTSKKTSTSKKTGTSKKTMPKKGTSKKTMPKKATSKKAMPKTGTSKKTASSRKRK